MTERMPVQRSGRNSSHLVYANTALVGVIMRTRPRSKHVQLLACTRDLALVDWSEKYRGFWTSFDDLV
eukprot:1772701-Alexandrium_andersonii.AAC.1